MVGLASRSYACKACREIFRSWTMRCSRCGAAGTIVSSAASAAKVEQAAALISGLIPSTSPMPVPAPVHEQEETPVQPRSEPIRITQAKEQILPRISTGMTSFDRVLGADSAGTGLAIGSCVIIGGDPGAGKSTILAQMMANIARAGHRVLYATGEESIGQAALRANRIEATHENVWILHETSTDWIIKRALDLAVRVLVVDSLQTLEGDGIGGTGSGVTLVRAATKLAHFAKKTDTIVVAIGHVTKEGKIAGPNTLAHAFDATLQITLNHEESRYRYLRSHKNRFGSTLEHGAFEMTASGMLDTDRDKAMEDDRELVARKEAEAAQGSSIEQENERLHAAIEHLRNSVDGYDVAFDVADQIIAGDIEREEDPEEDPADETDQERTAAESDAS